MDFFSCKFLARIARRCKLQPLSIACPRDYPGVRCFAECCARSARRGCPRCGNCRIFVLLPPRGRTCPPLAPPQIAVGAPRNAHFFSLCPLRLCGYPYPFLWKLSSFRPFPCKRPLPPFAHARFH